MKSSIIIPFYLETAEDNRGRLLSEILAWSDEKLEDVHDYIHWVFPSLVQSQFNPHAPLLKVIDMKRFRDSQLLRHKLRNSLQRMLAFYGLALEANESDYLVKQTSDFEIKSKNWITPFNHNFLRITRILKCLSVLGLQKEAAAFLEQLRKIFESHRETITEETFRYWQDAVN